MPLYGDLKYRDKLEYVTNYSVPVGWRSQYCGLFKADVDLSLIHISSQLIQFFCQAKAQHRVKVFRRHFQCAV